MAEDRTKRRLAAILAADVVGYSRLMEADESATLAALKERRKRGKPAGEMQAEYPYSLLLVTPKIMLAIGDCAGPREYRPWRH